MKLRILIFPALMAILNLMTVNVSSATVRSGVENGGLEFVNTLSSLSYQKELLASYRPWRESYIIIDRDHREKFVAINLNCRPSANCTQLEKTTEGVFAFSGTWLQPLPLPANQNYDYFYSDSVDSKSPTAEFFSMNPGVQAILEFVLPTKVQGTAYPGDFKSLYLHEGFHEFVQFASFHGIPSPWVFDLNELKSVRRNDSSYCRDPSHPAVVVEYVAQKSFVDALGRKADLDVLESLFADWDQRKTERYQMLPSAPPSDGVSTDCEKLDQIYERIEGLADYVAFESLVVDGQISLGQVTDYYDQSLLDAPAKALTPDMGFYAAGAAYAFFLDRLDATGNWKSSIVLDLKTDLRSLVQEKILQRRQIKHERRAIGQQCDLKLAE